MKTMLYTATPSVSHTHPGYSDALAAADYINKSIGDAGDGLFTADGVGEHTALQAVQAEIDSCHPSIRDGLTIEAIEIETETANLGETS
jgi:hypothetical protein